MINNKPSNSESAADGLCVSCHLCCTGALFSKLPVTDEEADRLGPVASFFMLDDEQLYLRLGCGALGPDGACTRFDRRPSGCGEYQCNVLQAVSTGAMARLRADYLVTEAKRLNDECLFFVRAAVPAELWDPDLKTASKAMLRLQIIARREGGVEPETISTAFEKWNAFADFIVAHFYDDPTQTYHASVCLQDFPEEPERPDGITII